MTQFLNQRHEILFLYDVKMSNPNGDTVDNSPRTLPDGTIYVTDVRLKRFIRDYLATQADRHIFVSKTKPPSTVTEVFKTFAKHELKSNKLTKQNKATLQDLLASMLDHYIDLRLFGSVFAIDKSVSEAIGNQPLGIFSPHTGPVQFSIGEVLHPADTIFISGTSVFASKEDKTQGTFTDLNVIRYGLIGFSGTVNQHNAAITRMTPEDYECLLHALWYGVASANTRSKQGQIPRLLVSIDFPEGSEQYIGRLHDLVTLASQNNTPATQWASPQDYTVSLAKLTELLANLRPTPMVRYLAHPHFQVQHLPEFSQCLTLTPGGLG